MAKATVLWFKRDLRITDNPALVQAVGRGDAIVPLYIAEPGYWALPDTSARQWDFIAECLAELRQDLTQLGQPLIVRTGDALSVLDALRQELPFHQILSHEETGNQWTFARDRAVAHWARGHGIAWDELPQSGVIRRLRSRDGWAAARQGFIGQAILNPPNALAPTGLAPGDIPTAVELRLRPDPCPGRQIGGRGQAMSLLGGFLIERGRNYRKDMSSPLAGEWACSRLSPYLAAGAISGREAARAAAARKFEVKGNRAGWSGTMASFTSRLAWRDHFIQKLEDEPRIETRCLHSAYETLRQGSDPDRLAAWAEGRTGLPFVDASMRFLRHTGWINFRMRSMLMAVASYHLWLDWRDSGMVLARLFTDYEPGIHWSQAQMQSGTTGMNTVRIYNPVKQGYDQDPEGIFTRRWVPELTGIADAYLQEPWTRGGWAGYPPPIVDIKAAAAAAREQIWAVRKGDPFRAEAQRIVSKHASRKTDRGFTRDPAPKEDKAQLSFDL